MTTDCVVIGGGIIGMMTAYKLANAGLKVEILDKSQSGRESSWAGGGLLSPIYPWDAPAALWPLVTRGNEVYPQLCEDLLNETGIDPEYKQSGLLNFEPEDIAKLDLWAEKTDSPYQIVDQQQIREIDGVANPIFKSAIWAPEIAQVRNPRLLQAFKKSLAQKQVKIREKVEVLSINSSNGQVTGVETSSGSIACQFAVVAAGAWSGSFLQEQSRIEPVRGQMLRVEVPEGFLKRILMKDSIYLIPRKDGHVLIGSSLEYVGFDKSITDNMANKLYGHALELLPDLKKYPVVQQWAGLRPGSENGIPIIEESAETKGLFINSGHFRNGVGLAPATCEILVSQMLGN